MTATPPDPRIEILSRRSREGGYFRIDRYELRHGLYAGGLSRTLMRERVERGDVVAVLPWDRARDELVWIEQFRIGALEDPAGAWLREIVAGVIEPGESAEAVARRETLEETGCTAGRLTPVASWYSSPGTTSERVHLYCAEVDATQAPAVCGLEEEGEDIRVRRVSVAKSLEWLARGAITSAIPLIALQWLALQRGQTTS